VEILEGGRKNQISRSGKTVIRPAGPWSKSVHALLTHLKQVGFSGAPEPLGFDNESNEILTYLAGEVSSYPLSEAAASEEALVAAAQLLRRYHDATISFLIENGGNQKWMLRDRMPVEVVCHGDYAPYNVVLNGRRAIAIIDFDTAHPGPRIWDIAYALYRWSPLKNPDNPDSLGTLEEQIGRARQFCDTYGVTVNERTNLVSMMVERLQTLINYMHNEAKGGNSAFQANLVDGHHLLYTADIAYLEQYKTEIDRGLSNF
jgi:Ser/Thr protein kinase RdoA (MazF antagonist)